MHGEYPWTMSSVEGSRRRAAWLVAAATSVLLVTSAASVHAQLGQGLPPLGGSPTTTAKPTTTAPGSQQSTTTTTARPGLLSPPTTPPPAATPSTTTTTEPPPPAGGDGTAAPKDAGAFPPELQAMVDSVRRTPANNTKKLVAALAPLQQYGLDPTQQAIVGFGRFPVAGVASWSDDWWFPRFGPGWRLHQGLDIFAPYGTPVRAPVDGTVRVTNSGIGGLAVYVRQPDRTYWYMCHLSGLAAGIAEGVTVKTGQVVGYVGTSGNARGGPSHMHFEIHPKGGPAVPPKPVVDRFVADAMNLVPQLLDAYAQADANRTPVTVPVAAPAPAIEALSPRAALLWATAANPAGGTLKLVEADALAAVDRIDWSAVVAASAERAAAVEASRALLLPLVPVALAEAAGWR
ncbi:MAG: Peptidase [Actinomycetia bacterium]|nr:Peptidase [Actinomycetes bacterium]